MAWLDGMRNSHLSRQVTYQRGDDSVELAATLGGTPYEVSDESGVTVGARATDFIVSAEALALAGVVTLPQVGDRIRLPDGEKVLVFEVLDLAGGGHYLPMAGGRMLRIHAKQVDACPP